MSTFDRLVKVFERVFGDDVATEHLTLTANLVTDVGMNSIGFLYMALALEEEFGVKFTNDDFKGLATVQDVITCIEGKK